MVNHQGAIDSSKIVVRLPLLAALMVPLTGPQHLQFRNQREEGVMAGAPFCVLYPLAVSSCVP
ncbi:MAG: hypothetical protein R3B95_08315 [Nitrospirales bacterium]|nr:hypothetical protein [Nitrospirales bacterium]